MRVWHRLFLRHRIAENVERYDVGAGLFSLAFFVDRCSCGKVWVS